MVSISVFNPEGEGPSTTITATTDEGSKRLKDWKDWIEARFNFNQPDLIMIKD